MGYASRSGRALTNPAAPRAFAVCDRCGFWYNHYKLIWQHQWQGTQLVNLNLLVCQTCLDVPQQQLKARILPPDPVPIANPRPELFGYAENDILATQPTATQPSVGLSTQSGNAIQVLNTVAGNIPD